MKIELHLRLACKPSLVSSSSALLSAGSIVQPCLAGPSLRGCCSCVFCFMKSEWCELQFSVTASPLYLLYRILPTPTLSLSPAPYNSEIASDI